MGDRARNAETGKDRTTDRANDSSGSSRAKNYSYMIMQGMAIPAGIYDKEKAQENLRRMTDTPVPFLILSMSVSTVLTMFIATTYNITATYFVAELGESCVAAVGIMFSVMALIQAVGYTWGMGAGSEISRLMGEGKKTEAERVLAVAFAGGIISGGVMALIFAVLGERVLWLLGATEGSLLPALSYGTWIMAAAPLMCGAYVLGNALRAEGQPYLAFLGIGAGGVTNLLMNYILIRKLGCGIRAAGVAAFSGQGLSLVVMYICASRKTSVVRLRLKALIGAGGRHVASSVGAVASRIVKTGNPSFWRQGLMCLAAVLTSRSLSAYGDSALAEVTVANKIFAVIFAVLIGYGQGFAPVCGFAFGAKLQGRVRSSLRFTMIISLCFMAAAGVLSYMFADDIVGVFLPDAASSSVQSDAGFSYFSDFAASYEQAGTGEIAVLALRSHAISMPFVAVCLVMGMYYQAVGACKRAAFISSLRQGVFFVPAIFILRGLYGLGGIACAQAAADVLAGVAAAVFMLIPRLRRTQTRSSRCL